MNKKDIGWLRLCSSYNNGLFKALRNARGYIMVRLGQITWFEELTKKDIGWLRLGSSYNNGLFKALRNAWGFMGVRLG